MQLIINYILLTFPPGPREVHGFQRGYVIPLMALDLAGRVDMRDTRVGKRTPLCLASAEMLLEVTKKR